MVIIIAATLTAVAATDKRMINLEKEGCRLNAILLAILKATFNVKQV